MKTTNAKGEPFNICTECEPNHVDNCRTCYGFGMYLGKDVPISAADATAGSGPDWIACSECGGTPAGIPKQLANEIALENFGKSVQVVQCQCEELRVALGNLSAAFKALPLKLQSYILSPSINLPSQRNEFTHSGSVTIRNYPAQGDAWTTVYGPDGKEQ